MCEMFGYLPEELVGKPIFALTHPADASDGMPMFSALRNGKMDRYTLNRRCLRRDESVLSARVTVVANRDRGTRTMDYAFLTIEDVTGMSRANQELARSNRDLEHFAYVASHDLKTPLRKVKGFTMLMKEELGPVVETLDEEKRDRILHYMSFVIEGADKSERLIDGLLAFSRTGRKMEVEKVSLDDALNDALFILSEDLEAKGCSVHRESLPIVRADASLMTRVFQNLIGNAIKFRSEEPPLVSVSSVERPSHWEIVVTDNGIGLDSRHQERAFLIFQRIGNKKKGMGLGLALCQRIVDRHGGKIWFDSVPGGGTAFHFTIPKEEKWPL